MILMGRGAILLHSTKRRSGVSLWTNFKKYACDLVHYIASVAYKSLLSFFFWSFSYISLFFLFLFSFLAGGASPQTLSLRH